MIVSTEEQPCLVCGYDLRATRVGERCPECGEEISADFFTEPAIPWLWRHRKGWVGAFFRTAYMVMVRPWRLWDEAVRPIDDRNARRFQWVCMGVPAVGAGGLVGWWMWMLMGSLRGGGWGRSWELTEKWDSWAMDLALPVVFTVKGVGFGLAAFLILMLTPSVAQVAFAVLRREGRVSPEGVRGAAMARYGSAGMLLMVLGAGFVAVGVWWLEGLGTRKWVLGPFFLGAFLLSFGVVAGLRGLLVMFGVPVVLMWKAGARGRRLVGGMVLGAVAWVWMVAVVVVGCVWLPGYLRLMWEAVR